LNRKGAKIAKTIAVQRRDIASSLWDTDEHGLTRIFSWVDSTFREDKRLRGEAMDVSEDLGIDFSRISRTQVLNRWKAERGSSVKIRFRIRNQTIQAPHSANTKSDSDRATTIHFEKNPCYPRKSVAIRVPLR